MRALFDYVPLEDKATPCQEAGLPFKRGDILQVVSQDDATWWQAKKVGDSNLRAGLIPSKQFQERCETHLFGVTKVMQIRYLRLLNKFGVTVKLLLFALRRLAYRHKMGTLPNSKSPKQTACEYCLYFFPFTHSNNLHAWETAANIDYWHQSSTCNRCQN